ncbi:MAG: HAMP domain-containing protein [Thermoanaerobaculia bacterium]|nr:HAMP domain-containing protein [Thermoanaerobaculia bacterium]
MSGERLLPRLRMLLWAPGLGAGVVAVGLLAWLLPTVVYESVEQTLDSTLEMLAPIAQKHVHQTSQEVHEWLHEIGEGSGLRLSLILADGLVLGDSERSLGELHQMDNHRSRPEVVEAFARGRGASVRRSDTTGEQYIYATRLIVDTEGQVFILRAARPLRELDRLKWYLVRLILVMLAGSGIGAMIVVSWIRRRVLTPFDDLVKDSDRLARSDLSHRLAVPGIEELEVLGKSLNRLADRAEEHVAAVDLERRRLAEILDGMAEGVLVADGSGEPIFANSAWLQLFEQGNDTETRDLLDLARRPALFELLGEARRSDRREELELRSGDRELAVSADRIEAFSGVLLVARDITEAKRLNRVRRDFVANVSHELKTPLAVIRAAAETIQGMGPDDTVLHERFSGRIVEQCLRLEDLLQDLLTLSRLESTEVEGERKSVNLTAVAERVVESLEPLAAQQGVDLRLSSPQPVQLFGEEFALERLLLNLVSNGVKYGADGGFVEIELMGDEREAKIVVRDGGPGIAASEVERIFERFYRVDKGRGREQGGSGLGLSIVKHVVQSHAGSIKVDSRPGEGARFEVRLPRRIDGPVLVTSSSGEPPVEDL